jgi:hypothetical protein
MIRKDPPKKSTLKAVWDGKSGLVDMLKSRTKLITSGLLL